MMESENSLWTQIHHLRLMCACPPFVPGRPFTYESFLPSYYCLSDICETVLEGRHIPFIGNPIFRRKCSLFHFLVFMRTQRYSPICLPLLGLIGFS